MEKKNKKMLLVVGVLLLFGSISFAYFIGTSLFEGTGSKTEAITASIKGETVNVDGGLTFNDLDILPGHQTISSIKVTATGNNELIPYNLIWNGTNNLSTPLEFKVYKTTNKVDVSASCEKKIKVENGYQILNEECTIYNLDKLGSVVSSGTIETATDTTKVILASDEFITATNDGMSVYYYVILEYPNLDEEQNEDMGGNFNGTVTVEESNAKPDINILAVKIEGEDGTYQDSEDIPQEGYRLNTTNSICSNGATAGWDTNNNRFYTDNLTKKGTSCYLYFDKMSGQNASTIIASIDKNSKTITPTFKEAATTDEKVYKVSDGMYDGNSYYWRGAATTNHLIFAEKCWRIIRINGDGTIRLIYNGSILEDNVCPGNGPNSKSIAVSSQKYNLNYDNSSYVGWTYKLGYQRPSATTSGTELSSNAKIQTEKWYNENIGNNEKYNSMVAEGKFCNDRRIENNANWIANTSGLQNYEAKPRIVDKYEPSLDCNENDVYILKVGAITADEVAMAGGTRGNNTYYYLYNGSPYWTMTPSYMQYSTAWEFFVGGSGNINIRNSGNVEDTYGLRPVINLRSDIELTGTGTASDPYIVVGGN